MNSQIHEIGLFVGGSNFVGDVGATTYISPNKPVLGIIYKWNRNPRLAYRFSLNYAKITANDAESDDPGRYLRSYSFTNTVKEAGIGFEFNFFNFNLHEFGTKLTPYVSSGLNYFQYNNTYNDTQQIKTNNGSKSSVAIPMIVGVKSRLFNHFVIGLEVGARYTFTDNIDGSNPTDSGLPKFGNINNNDWYVFSGLTLTYTYGNKPCYCTE